MYNIFRPIEIKDGQNIFSATEDFHNKMKNQMKSGKECFLIKCIMVNNKDYQVILRDREISSQYNFDVESRYDLLKIGIFGKFYIDYYEVSLMVNKAIQPGFILIFG